MCRIRMRFVNSALVVTVFVSLPSVLLADGQYSVDLGGSTKVTSNHQISQSLSVFGVNSDHFISDDAGNHSSLHSSGSAGPFGLSAEAQTDIFCPDIRFIDLSKVSKSNQPQADVVLKLDDVVISGPAGGVTTSLNLRLFGGIGANSFIVNGQSAEGAASANVFVGAIGSFGILGFNGDAQVNSFDGFLNDVSASGLLSGYGGSGALPFTTPTFTAIANEPMLVTLDFSVQASSFVTGGGGAVPGLPQERVAEGTASFFDTLTFADVGAVFNLPPGYTVNSAEGMIIDNTFTPLPEPSTLALFAAGLTGLTIVCRNRRLRRAASRLALEQPLRV